MNIRATALALPVAFELAAACAIASPVTLSPFGPAQETHVATVGPKNCAAATPAQLTNPFHEYPPSLKIADIEGVASVGVTLSEAGRPTRAWLIQSTGNPLLDRAAMKTALASSYTAEQAQCIAVGGDYKIRVEFSDQ